MSMLNRRRPQDSDYPEAVHERVTLLGTSSPSDPNQFPSFNSEGYELSSRDLYSRVRVDLASPETFRQTHSDFIYYTVQPGDTLQNLSVKYNCPVASIKRLNNLWSDQEFFGLTRLKLPVGKLRLLESQLVGTSVDAPIVTQNLVEPQSGDSLFKDLDLSIERARTAAQTYDAGAIVQSLADGGHIVADDPSEIAMREAETLLVDMSDYGLSYNALLLFIFIVCLVCPLAYVIYLEETHIQRNREPSS